MTRRRLPVLVVLVLALVGLVVADRASTRPRTDDVVAATGLMPVASRSGAVSSAFYCAGGVAAPGALFDTTVVVSNSGGTPANAAVTVYPAALPGDAAGAAAVAKVGPVRKSFPIAARTRIEVHLADIQPSPFAAALVETSDAGIGVERRVASADGSITSSSPCASSPSDTWYLPTGTTTRDARELIAVFNPFPADAVLDLTFQTSDGFRAPPALQSLPVPGGQLRVFDISQAAPRIEQLAATVVARTGRVVVDRLQSFDGSDPKHPLGLAVTLGAPAAAPVWTFGFGRVEAGVNETITLMNPSSAVVHAQLEVSLDDPATNGQVDPIPVSIPIRGFAQISMSEQTRIPPAIEHAVTVRALDGDGVIAEQVMTATAPTSSTVYAPALGAPLVSARWLFAEGRTEPGQVDEFVSIVNPDSDAVARVDVTALVDGQAKPVDGLQGVEVPRGGRISLQLAPHISHKSLTLLVEADRPIVVERALYAANGKGFSLAAGLPTADSASLPPTRRSTTTTTTAPLPPPPSS